MVGGREQDRAPDRKPGIRLWDCPAVAEAPAQPRRIEVEPAEHAVVEHHHPGHRFFGDRDPRLPVRHGLQLGDFSMR